jgi:DNA-binding transcriptional ArsR family regulator
MGANLSTTLECLLNVITVRIDPERLSRSRFVLSRLVELTNGLEVLAHPERAPFAHGWVRRTRGRLDLDRVAVLFALAERATWYVPDFIVPIPGEYEPGLADELDRVAATPADVVREQLALAFRIGPPPSAAVHAHCHTGADPRPPLPVEVRAVLDDGGPEALAHRVAAELDTLWRVSLADTWPMVARILDQDVRHRAAMAGRRGFGDILADLTDVGWDGRSLTVRKAADVTLDPRPGVLLAPSVFLSAPAVWLGAPEQVMLGYVARGRGRVWATPDPAADHSRVLGRRRTALLADLRTARSTTELAGRHTLSPATISYHLSRLHDAGLVTRRQAGHEVLYEQTDLATRLFTALTEPV